MQINIINKTNQEVLSEQKSVKEYFEEKIKQNLLKEHYEEASFKLNIKKREGLYKVELIYIPIKGEVIRLEENGKKLIEKGINSTLKKLSSELSSRKVNKKEKIGPRVLNKIYLNDEPIEEFI